MGTLLYRYEINLNWDNLFKYNPGVYDFTSISASIFFQGLNPIHVIKKSLSSLRLNFAEMQMKYLLGVNFSTAKWVIPNKFKLLKQ
jgi:hypothetical protein